MLLAISVVPPAASCTDRDISFVVAVCSSTAQAMVVCRSEIWATIVEISSIAATAAVVSPWIASTRRAMSSVALAVSWASSLTSLATTAKPLPASPARAASMVAFSASRLVCSAMLGDHLDDVADLGRGLAQLGDGRGRGLRGGDGAGGDLAGLGGVRGDLPDRGTHLLGAGGDGLHAAARPPPPRSRPHRTARRSPPPRRRSAPRRRTAPPTTRRRRRPTRPHRRGRPAGWRRRGPAPCPIRPSSSLVVRPLLLVRSPSASASVTSWTLRVARATPVATNRPSARAMATPTRISDDRENPLRLVRGLCVVDERLTRRLLDVLQLREVGVRRLERGARICVAGGHELRAIVDRQREGDQLRVACRAPGGESGGETVAGRLAAGHVRGRVRGEAVVELGVHGGDVRLRLVEPLLVGVEEQLGEQEVRLLQFGVDVRRGR